MNLLTIYFTHWSDTHQSWSYPCETRVLEADENFGFFVADNEAQAVEFVSQLKPLIALRPIGYYPSEFHLGSFPIELISSSKV